MFPGCTITDMRLRQEDLLRQAGYEPQPRPTSGAWITNMRLRLDRSVVAWTLSLLALLGRSFVLR